MKRERKRERESYEMLRHTDCDLKKTDGMHACMYRWMIKRQSQRDTRWMVYASITVMMRN